MTIYSVIKRDGSIRNRNKFKRYNDSCRVANNKWKRDNPERRIMYDQRANEKRCKWGCIPINKKFDGSVFHHMHVNDNREVGIYVPEYINRPHHSHKDASILAVNAKAMYWLAGQPESSYSDVYRAILSC